MTVTYETVREWCLKFGPLYARRLHSRSPRPGDRWHLAEVFLKINGRLQYLWRAVDRDGEVLDILVQSRRNKPAARKFFRKLLKAMQYVPRVIIADKLGSYAAAKAEVLPSVEHHQDKGVEQPGGEFAPTHPRAGTSHERLQIPWARTAIPVGVRGSWIIRPSRPAFTGRRELPRDHGRRFTQWRELVQLRPAIRWELLLIGDRFANMSASCKRVDGEFVIKRPLGSEIGR